MSSDMNDVSDIDAVGVPTPSRGCKRVGNVLQWKKYAAKIQRDAGQEYVSRATGKEVAAKKIGNPCRDGCFDKISMPVIQEVFSDFWGVADYDKQNAYIRSLVRSKPVKRRRKPLGDKPPVRTQTREYTITYQNNVHTVCKAGFLSILSVSDTRMRTALSKVTDTGAPIGDKRGRHPPGTKKDKRVVKLIEEHMGSIPIVSSHYTRAKSPNRKYLGSELNMTKLYKLYRTWMTENYANEEKVKLSYYRKIVRTKFNIGFAPMKRSEKTPQAELYELESVFHEHRTQTKKGKKHGRRQGNKGTSVQVFSSAEPHFFFVFCEILLCVGVCPALCTMPGNRTGRDNIVKLIELHKVGKNNREIANQTGVTESTVSRLLKKWRAEGGGDKVPVHKHAGGKALKISPKALKLLKRELDITPSITAKELKNKNPKLLGDVSVRTIQENIQKRLNYSKVKARVKPLVTAKQGRRRVQFAKGHKDWDLVQWHKVLWTDEETSKDSTISDDAPTLDMSGKKDATPQVVVSNNKQTMLFPPCFQNTPHHMVPSEIRRETPDCKSATEGAPVKAVYIFVPGHPSTSSNESSNLHWSRKDTTWLISMYRQQSCLWNVKSADYKNRKMRLAALTAIKTELQKKHGNITIKDIKKKLDTLRSQYRREMRQLENSRKSGSLTDDVYSPKCWCFGDLSFLTDGDTMRTSPSNINLDTFKEAVVEHSDHEVTGKNKEEDENQNSKDISFSAGNRQILPNVSLKKLLLSPTKGLMARDSEGLHCSGPESEGSLTASESQGSIIFSGKHKKKSVCANQVMALVTDSMHPLQNDSRQECNSDSTRLELFSATGIKEEPTDFSHLCSDQDIPVEESNMTATNDKLRIKEIKVASQRDSLQEEFLSTNNNGPVELATVNSQFSGLDTYGKRKRRRNESYNEPGGLLGTGEAFVKSCKDQKEANTCDAFGRYIALQLKQLPIENALNLQMVIHNLVVQERLKVQQKEVSMKKSVVNTKASDDPTFGIHNSVKESSTNDYYMDNSTRKEATAMVNKKSSERSSSVKKTSKIEEHNKDRIQVQNPQKSSLRVTAAVMRQPDTFPEDSPGMTAAVNEQPDEVYNFENQSLLNITIDKQEFDDDFSYWDAPSPISVKSEAESISSG
ncbi:uncharacterized protein [Palaemon carinicauda]|uniref:uncharacterized protein n=1 Tax=Palaemon carinicauda TaxID=392227 RepID=UPI0035B5B250